MWMAKRYVPGCSDRTKIIEELVDDILGNAVNWSVTFTSRPHIFFAPEFCRFRASKPLQNKVRKHNLTDREVEQIFETVYYGIIDIVHEQLRKDFNDEFRGLRGHKGVAWAGMEE